MSSLPYETVKRMNPIGKVIKLLAGSSYGRAKITIEGYICHFAGIEAGDYVDVTLGQDFLMVKKHIKGDNK